MSTFISFSKHFLALGIQSSKLQFPDLKELFILVWDELNIVVCNKGYKWAHVSDFVAETASCCSL